MIAKWGDIEFKVSSKRVLSFKKMKRTYCAQWEEHDIIGKRPKMEFKGPGMDEITMEVVLDAELGVKPRKVLKKFRTAAKNGEIHYFYVGGKKVCKNKMYIASGSESWDEIWSEGELIRATASITFGEYR